MKKSLVILGSLLSISALAGCNESTPSNEEKPHEHSFKTEFAHDETNHWHEASCEHTDLISGLKAHNFGEDNVCDDCGYVKATPEDPHEHSFSDVWSKDETNHWHAATCEHITLTSGLAAHIFGDDNICDDCGYTKPTPIIPHEHSFATAWTHDETNHWHAASCEHTELVSGLEAHNFGDDNICDDCEYVKPAPAHEHTFSTEWTKDAENHWHAAACEHGNLISGLAAHNFNGDDECDDCGYTKPSPAHEHSFATVWEHDETNHWHAATCEHTELTSGLEAHDFGDDNVCDDCGYEKPAPAHIHSFSTEWSIDEAKHWHASTCGHDFVEGLEDHTYGANNICTVCGFKKIEKHKITYANWPDEIENLNPTNFVRTDDFVLDGSTIEEKEGFSNVKFIVDGNEVTTLMGIDKDVTVTVTYDASVTKMTINPDNDRDESFDINVSYWSKPSDLIGEFSRSGHDFVCWVDGEGNKVNIDERWENLDSTFTLTAKWKFIAIDKYISNLEEYKSSLIVEAAKGVGEDPVFALLVDELDRMMKTARNELLLKEYTKAEADEIVEKHEKQLNTAAVAKILPILMNQFLNAYTNKLAEIGADPVKRDLVTTYFTSHMSFGGPEAKMKDVILSYQVAMLELNAF